MNENKIEWKNVYVLFNGRVTELMGTKIKFEIKNFNFKFWIQFNISITVF